MIKIVICVAAMLLLGACAGTPTWKQAKTVPPLTIPAGLDTPGIKSEMAVPEVGDAGGLPPPRSTRPPASDRSMTLTLGMDAAWTRVGAVLESAKVGDIVKRDAARHLYRLKLSSAEVKPPPRSFWHRLWHRELDISGVHYADVSIIPAGNGNSTVQIDGDDLAVAKLHRVLEASTVDTDAHGETADAKRN